MKRTKTHVVMAILLGVGALSLSGPAAGHTSGGTDGAIAARPSLKGVWEGQFAGQTLRIRITTFRKAIPGRAYFATQYDGSPGNFESPDCEISLRFKRRVGLKYYFKGSFKNVGLGCPVQTDNSDRATQTVVLQRSGTRLIFQTKVEGDVTKGKLKRR